MRILRAPKPHRFEWEASRRNRHHDVQTSAQIDRHRRGGVGEGSDDGADDAHHAVETNGDAVTGATMGGRQDFWGVRVKAAVVDVLKSHVLVTSSLEIGARRLESHGIFVGSGEGKAGGSK